MYSPSNDTKSEKNINEKNVYLLPLAKVDNFNYLRWSIYELTENKEHFYAKNSYFGDHLCATYNKQESVFLSRGNIKRLRIITKLSDYSDNCKWTIKRADSSSILNKSTYFIDIVFYGESLYPTSSFFDNLRKNV